MEILINKIMSFIDINPSLYISVVTASDRVLETPEFIDQMANEGKFPKLIELFPSIFISIILSICRMILQRYIFKVILFYLFTLLLPSFI